MKIADLLVVVRTGVYDQGVVGIANNIEDASAIAEAAAKRENDNYHDFHVRGPGDDGEFDREVRVLANEGNYRTGRRAWDR